jgi:hypothetical protein
VKYILKSENPKKIKRTATMIVLPDIRNDTTLERRFCGTGLDGFDWSWLMVKLLREILVNLLDSCYFFSP